MAFDGRRTSGSRRCPFLAGRRLRLALAFGFASVAGTNEPAAAGAPPAAAEGRAPPACPGSARVPATDWGKAIVDTTMRLNPPTHWKYQEGLFLHGAYLVYERLRDPAYLAFIRGWADQHLDG